MTESRMTPRPASSTTDDHADEDSHGPVSAIRQFGTDEGGKAGGTGAVPGWNTYP